MNTQRLLELDLLLEKGLITKENFDIEKDRIVNYKKIQAENTVFYIVISFSVCLFGFIFFGSNINSFPYFAGFIYLFGLPILIILGIFYFCKKLFGK